MKWESLAAAEKLAIESFFQRRGLPLDIALTFDEVAVVDEYSEVRSRLEIHDFRTRLLADLELNLPIISANMKSVSGAEMIVAMEREGGLGIPPQTESIDYRLEILEKVTRAECAVIDDPFRIGPEATLADVRELTGKLGVSGLLVVDEKNTLVGILSSRDWRYESDERKLVRQLMTSPEEKELITATRGVSLEVAAQILRRHKVEKLPVVDPGGRLVGLITARGVFYKSSFPRALRDSKGRFVRVGSLGVVGRRTEKELLRELDLQMKKGIVALLIDTPNGHSRNMADTIGAVKRVCPLPVIAGNVSTAEGAKFLLEQGADSVKVGQGPGAACRTREVAGNGLPQLTAIAECGAIAHLYGKTVIADGGIKGSPDLQKALIAGADAVMLGALLCGTWESAATARPDKDDNLQQIKIYEGAASFAAQMERLESGGLDKIREPEGVSDVVPIRGTVSYILNKLLDGLRSGMAYWGARNIAELKEKGYFRRQGPAGYYEGTKK